ncbi:MAG: N-formylglutamate deformylase [Gammaproteobacteria bacterium]|nr:N-formylglutamate deformylase [Gammaproteobacteria bacterium]
MYEYHQGDLPVLINVPHCGTRLPETLASSMTEEALQLSDTDWHVDRLYGFAKQLGASVLSARMSRYVIDLNRPPDDAALYDGMGGTGLCPTETFDGNPLYLDGCAVDQANRLREYWQPYHDKLSQTLESIRDKYGFVVLLDAHSIRSVVPRLFTGQLADFNLGSNSGASCDSTLTSLAVAALTSDDYSLVVDGRFKGGYITRHYGNPAGGVHALQLELSQRTYMQEAPPYSLIPEKAESLSNWLKTLVTQLLTWSP